MTQRVAFSPDGKLLATADGDGTVRLWNPATGQPIGAPLQPPALPTCHRVAFSPDGKLLASAGGDGTVRLWDPVTGQPAGSALLGTQRRAGVPGEVAFSPDGKLLATADGDGTVRLWNPATGQPVGAPLPVDPAAGERGGVQPGRQAAGQRRRRRHGAAVEPGHRPARRRRPSTHQRQPSGVNGVAFSPDGKLLATADGDGTVRLWNPVTGQPVGAPSSRHRPHGGVNAVAFSPDGKLLATADDDGRVRLWNPVTGQPVGAPLPADTSWLRERGGVQPGRQAAGQRRR